MIKGLTGSPGLIVSGGNTSVPYVNQNSNNPITGMMRVWGNDIQVFDGTSWLSMSTSYATVGLDSETQDLLHWARKKRQEEADLYKLASSNEAVRIALEQLEQAKTRVELTTILAREYETTS
jgi:hypothetical protein